LKTDKSTRLSIDHEKNLSTNTDSYKYNFEIVVRNQIFYPQTKYIVYIITEQTLIQT